MVSSFTFFDIAIGGIAFISLFLIFKNMKVGSNFDLGLPLRARKGDEGIEAFINGKWCKGVAYVSQSLPRGGEDLPKRIVRLARSSRISVSFVSNMYSVEKGPLIKMIEDEIKRAEMGFSSTGGVKYRERMKFLEGLYKEVARSSFPYVGNFGFIVWIDPDDKDSILSAEAFRNLVEAEAQVKVKKVDRGIEEVLSLKSAEGVLGSNDSFPLASAEEVSGYEGVVIGEEEGEPGKLVTLPFPEAFMHHFGIFGPTGRGKTLLLAGIASQLLLLSSLRGEPSGVVAIDPKGDLSALLKRISTSYLQPTPNDCIFLPRKDGIAKSLIESSVSTGEGYRPRICQGFTDLKGLTIYDLSKMPNEARNAFGSLLITSLALRASESKLAGKKVLIIDEAWRFAKDSQLHLEFALREGRSKGLYLVYATQMPSDVKGEILGNTGAKAVFGGFTRLYAELSSALGIRNVEHLMVLPVGYLILKMGSEEEKIVKVIDFNKLLISRYRQ
ncbi:MAG: DUF87 domain-containing protein [Caldisphaeraceae archaeon]|nr:DUF87 domain-containing protein [Caldisphaeraceae archaeon]MEB3797299.1 DUF87 domain-containing protein [Caldisphaeraceae archaeon]